MKNGRGRREKPPPAPNKQQGKTPERRPRTRFKARASKPSLRECPNRRREVHYNSAAETAATLAAAETATLKQAKAPTAPLAGRAKLPKPRAWRRGADGEAGGASRAERTRKRSAEQRERRSYQTNEKSSRSCFLDSFLMMLTVDLLNVRPFIRI